MRAAGVELVGRVPDSGFARPQWLVQREGHYVQVTELLYRILELADGRRTYPEIASEVAAGTGRPLNADNVRTLVAAKLLPLRLLAPADDEASASAPSGLPVVSPLRPGNGDGTRTPRPSRRGVVAPSWRPAQMGRMGAPLQLTLRLGVLGPQAIDPVARVMQVLFVPPVCVALLLFAALGQLWLFGVHGIGAAVVLVLSQPALFLVLVGCILLFAVFHEFGHAAALRYGGGRARAIGFGFYLTVPAFYTDCTESYRLGRWARLRTDLGGVYINLIMTLGLFILYAMTHAEVLLAAVLLLDVVIAEQFSPLVRYDGYWALADLIGVPDFFTLMGPVICSLLPRRLRPTGVAVVSLKGWVRIVFVSYTVVVVPLLGLALFLLIARAPLVLGFYWAAFLKQAHIWGTAWRGGELLRLVLEGVQILLLLVSAVFLVYGVGRLLFILGSRLWAWGNPSEGRRALATLALLGTIALLVLVWAVQMGMLAPRR